MTTEKERFCMNRKAPSTPTQTTELRRPEGEELLSDLQKAYISIGRLKNSIRHKKIVLEIEKKLCKK